MQTNCRKKPLTFGKFIAKLRAATAFHVPAGYEDESGFHYGADAGDGFFQFLIRADNRGDADNSAL